MPVSAAYIKKHFTEDDRVSVEEIIKLIKSQFGNVIKSLDWMDGNSKETALAKLSNVAEYISGPEELDGNELLNEIYDAVRSPPRSLPFICIYLSFREYLNKSIARKISYRLKFMKTNIWRRL